MVRASLFKNLQKLVFTLVLFVYGAAASAAETGSGITANLSLEAVGNSPDLVALRTGIPEALKVELALMGVHVVQEPRAATGALSQIAATLTEVNGGTQLRLEITPAGADAAIREGPYSFQRNASVLGTMQTVAGDILYALAIAKENIAYCVVPKGDGVKGPRARVFFLPIPWTGADYTDAINNYAADDLDASLTPFSWVYGEDTCNPQGANAQLTGEIVFSDNETIAQPLLLRWQGQQIALPPWYAPEGYSPATLDTFLNFITNLADELYDEAAIDSVLALQADSAALIAAANSAIDTGDAYRALLLATQLPATASERMPLLEQALLSAGDLEQAEWLSTNNQIPQTPRTVILRANALSYLEGSGATIAELEAALTVFPGDVSILLKLAETHSFHADASVAKDIYARIMESEPANAAALFGMGSILEREGNPEDALALYDAALEADPENPFARPARTNLLFERAWLQALRGDLGQSLETYALVLAEEEHLDELSPQISAAWLNTLEIHVQNRDYTTAQNMLAARSTPLFRAEDEHLKDFFELLLNLVSGNPDLPGAYALASTRPEYTDLGWDFGALRAWAATYEAEDPALYAKLVDYIDGFERNDPKLILRSQI